MLCPPGLSKSPESRFTGPPGGEWVLHGTATGQGGVAARPACDGECLLACRLRLLLLGLLVLLVVFLGVVAFAHDSFPRVVWGSRYKTGAESSHGRAIWATGFSLPNCMPRLPTGPNRRDGRSLVAVAFSPSTTYGSAHLRRSKNPKAPRASADPGSPPSASNAVRPGEPDTAIGHACRRFACRVGWCRSRNRRGGTLRRYPPTPPRVLRDSASG